uniref:Uncharacterized protein n=1 Tax=Anguilla anguilla TaxID=7936 RepID=A0A0E9RK17_ANGAN
MRLSALCQLALVLPTRSNEFKSLTLLALALAVK